jgi:hypothetical protein
LPSLKGWWPWYSECIQVLLLGKWLWRYATEREALWYKVIKEKYEEQDGGWCSKEVCGTFGVGLWKHIRRGYMFARNVRFEV